MQFNSSFYKKHRKKILFTVATPVVLFFIFLIFNFIFPLKINIKYSSIVVSKEGKVMSAYLTADDKWRMMIELNEINGNLQKAIINKEDKYFYYHPGFNLVAICRAAFNNIIFHRRTSGASTITMQVARLLAPQQRTYGAKLLELFRAMQLEFRFSKSEILQLYLNLVPYGSNVEGVKSAAYLYFEKSPSQLSLAEATTLAIIPNQPSSLQLGKNNATIILKRNKWLNRFAADKVFPQILITQALAEPLEVVRHEAPTVAQHLCLRMKKEYPQQPIIHTTVDYKLQIMAQKIVQQYMQPMKNRNVHNACVVVIDNATADVVAYLGSDNFDDDANNGQVDGVQAIRSPGSTLKPLLYATAIDKGLLTPKTKIADVPILITGYQPDNYDDKFHGMVTAEYALANSLNIPAVKTLKDVGMKDFIGKLDTAGFRSIRQQEKKLGLSMILGGCGASLEQLTNLYTIFANEGKFKKVNYILDNKKENAANKSYALLSPASSFMITEVLTTLTRPDLPNNFESSPNLVKVAWKTGTSYGRKDAWSIGFNKKYTIGVWVGNFDGTGVPELNGADFATPLLFQLFNSLDYHSRNDWFTPPPTLQYRLVCSETGLPPNHFCKNIIADTYLPQVSSNELCNHLKSVFTNRKKTISYCTTCLPDTGYVAVWYPNYPASLVAYYDGLKINYEKIPPHNPACERVFSDGEPIIISPARGLKYYLDEKEKQQLKLQCQAANDVEQVFWFVNGKFLKSVGADRAVFFIPEKGELKITCVDDKGRKSSVNIEVKAIE